jgi:hypothetical protein
MLKRLLLNGKLKTKMLNLEPARVESFFVVEGAKDFVKQSVIQAAVTKLISMFIPGGGIIQLFMTAFDMVKFVINEGSRIASLASSIMGSVAAIAQGNVTGAISKVEQSLAKAVPLALSFMSRIFRVSGIGTKIKAIIQKVKGKIDGVVKKLMDKVAAQVAKIAGAIGKGATNAVNGVKKLINGVFGKKSFTAGKESHSVWVQVKNNEPKLMIASTPREATAQLDAIELEAKQKGALPKVQPLITDARAVVAKAKQDLAKGLADPSKADEKEMTVRASNVVNRVEGCIKNVFDELAKHAGTTDKMPLTTVTFESKGYDAREYRLQIAEQQNAINVMKIKQWLGDRSNFLAKVGNPTDKKKFYADSGKHQDEERKKAAADWEIKRAEALEKQYLSEGVPAKEAEKKAEQQAKIDVAAWMDTQAALHMPDKIAGGKVNAINAMGDRNINSSIGSSWKTRVSIVDKAVAKIDVALHEKVQMNVSLTVK